VQSKLTKLSESMESLDQGQRAVEAAVKDVADEVNALDANVCAGRIKAADVAEELKQLVAEAAKNSQRDTQTVLTEMRNQFGALEQVGPAVVGLADGQNRIVGAVDRLSVELKGLDTRLKKGKTGADYAAKELHMLVTEVANEARVDRVAVLHCMQLQLVGMASLQKVFPLLDGLEQGQKELKEGQQEIKAAVKDVADEQRDRLAKITDAVDDQHDTVLRIERRLNMGTLDRATANAELVGIVKTIAEDMSCKLDEVREELWAQLKDYKDFSLRTSGEFASFNVSGSGANVNQNSVRGGDTHVNVTVAPAPAPAAPAPAMSITGGNIVFNPTTINTINYNGR
jgi:type II secretory pathway component PulM